MSAFRAQGVLDLDRDVIAVRDFKTLNGLARISAIEAAYSTVA